MHCGQGWSKSSWFAKALETIYVCCSLLVRAYRALDVREYLMIIFLISIETISSDPTSELFHRGGSDEGSQHIF